MKTPVVLLIFNRPNLTRQVFEAIRQAQPQKLLVVADGPRPDRLGEVENCSAARAIISNVDWKCDVLTNYSDHNLGCKQRVTSGLDWVFDTVEQAIVLEDDCLPHPSFFPFCEELLEKYSNDPRVMQICGSNVYNMSAPLNDSYYFSKYGVIWGWASWRRAWKLNDMYMKIWPEIRDEKLYLDFCIDGKEALRRLKLYNKVYSGEIDTWDYQWGFAKMINSGLSIVPGVNLITNIGYGEQATHTHSKHSPLANLPVSPVDFPLKHPSFVIRNYQADKVYSEKRSSPTRNPIGKLKNILLNQFGHNSN